MEIEGAEVPAEKVFEPPTFAEVLGIEELRMRRAAVVRRIDLALSQIGKEHENYAFRKISESRKFALLAREEKLESEYSRNCISAVCLN